MPDCWWADAVVSLAIVVLLVREGREAWEAQESDTVAVYSEKRLNRLRADRRNLTAIRVCLHLVSEAIYHFWRILSI
jgi:hypothetical protein